MRICDAAELVLRETGNPAVMWGDDGLLHHIAKKAGIASNGPRTADNVIAALSRQPGNLVPGFTPGPAGMKSRMVRIFRLKEAPHAS